VTTASAVGDAESRESSIRVYQPDSTNDSNVIRLSNQ